MKFEVRVWFRYSIANELEKDFSYHEIEAESKEEAEIKATKLYASNSVIPFKIEFI